MNLIGPVVRELRLGAGLTQQQLAARLELQGLRIDRGGLAKIECGARGVSDVELAALSAALEVSPNRLLRWHGAKT